MSEIQTLLPYPSFTDSARVLDDQRLGKQRANVIQVLRALDGRCRTPQLAGYRVVRMWRGYPEALAAYGLAVCTEWRTRGNIDTCYGKIVDLRDSGLFVRWWIVPPSPFDFGDADPSRYTPSWLGDPQLHASHRSLLLRRAPHRYRQVWPDEPDDLPTIWPQAVLPSLG